MADLHGDFRVEAVAERALVHAPHVRQHVSPRTVLEDVDQPRRRQRDVRPMRVSEVERLPLQFIVANKKVALSGLGRKWYQKHR